MNTSNFFRERAEDWNSVADSWEARIGKPRQPGERTLTDEYKQSMADMHRELAEQCRYFADM